MRRSKAVELRDPGANFVEPCSASDERTLRSVEAASAQIGVAMSLCDVSMSLAKGGAVMPRVLGVFAHPDDEILAVGARLERLVESQFLCVTDGAPLDGKDAHAHGFARLDQYRVVRRQEQLAAFTLAGLNGSACSRWWELRGSERRYVSDQTAAFHLAELARELVSEIRSFAPDAVLTHPYEGGHPDHDACAFAVYAATRLLTRKVPVVEAAFYHAGPNGIETGVFLPGGSDPETVDELSSTQRMSKQQLLACFGSQRETLELFDTQTERYRAAPAYDFRRPPHEGPLYYEGFPWGMTGDRFCQLAGRALDELGLPVAAR